MKKRIFPLLLVATLLFSLAACGEEEETPPETQSTAVEVAKVQRGSISAESSVSGQVVSGTQESVFVATSAQCTDVYVEVGDTVSAGQAICKVDISAITANYKTAQMSYSSTQKNYAEQSAVLSEQVAMLEKTLSDTKALYEMGAASQLEVDNAQLQLNNARASMNSALDQLKVAMQNYQATMDQLEASLANINGSGNVVAPISGNVVSLSAMENGFLSPSAAVVTIDSTTDMEIQVGVSEALVGKLQVGGTVSVQVSSADKEFQATITSIDKSANAQTHLYGVSIKVPAGYTSGLLSGMFADVVFYTDTQRDVVIIPTEAIQTGTDGSYVYTLDSENIAHRVAVETGLVGDGETEITSGLSGGETLVTVGQFYLSEGAAARVVSSEVAS